jgi:2-keto-3-deoxy-L-rhamnonate aldolase RhmA
MGNVGLDLKSPEFRDAIKTVLKAVDSAKKPAGIGIYADATDPDGPKKEFVDMGFRMILAGGDQLLLSHGLSLFQKSFGAARKGG